MFHCFIIELISVAFLTWDGTLPTANIPEAFDPPAILVPSPDPSFCPLFHSAFCCGLLYGCHSLA